MAVARKRSTAYATAAMPEGIIDSDSEIELPLQRYRTLRRAGELKPDPAQELGAQLGDNTLTIKTARPSLEDVFVASTHGEINA